MANVPLADTSTAGTVIIGSGLRVNTSNKLVVNSASSNTIKSGTDLYTPIVPGKQNESVFYGLAKAAGDSTQASSDNTVGTYTDNAKSAIRTMIGAAAASDLNIKEDKTVIVTITKT